MKHILKLQDGRIEPIKDLMKSEKEFALRRILVDKEMGGAETITFGWAVFEPKTSYHKKHVHPNAEEVFFILSGEGIGGVGEGTQERRSSRAIQSGYQKGPCIGCTIPLISPARSFSFMPPPPLRRQGTKSSSNISKISHLPMIQNRSVITGTVFISLGLIEPFHCAFNVHKKGRKWPCL